MDAYARVNSSFKSLSKTLFGREIGELSEFDAYFREMLLPHTIAKSSVSGKEVLLSNGLYPKGARFVSQDEAQDLKIGPLGIDQIKDIDSLLDAVSGRAAYCGNKVFGKNFNAEGVDNCVESSNVIFCNNNYHVKDAAYCSQVREAEAIFGVTTFPFIRHSMRCVEGMNLTRGFETYYTTNSSDMYYAFNCSGCTNCMFAFNLRNKSNCIGNLELGKERYNELKAKLVAEIAGELAKKKRIFSMGGLSRTGVAPGQGLEVRLEYGPVPPRVEKAFGSTCATVLGKEHAGLGKFGKWLARHALKIRKVRGAHGTPTYAVDLPIVREIPAERLATAAEALENGKIAIELKGNEMPPLAEIAARAVKNALFTLEFSEGHAENAVDVTAIFNANNVYAFWDATESSLSAFASAVIKSKMIFGGYLRMLQSSSCINCYDSTDLNRCFEVDGSYGCSDSYFLHNCENVSDSMFCFNAKNMRYAIGNVVVGREEFARVKKILLDYVNMSLEKDGALGMDIFSIGERKSS